MNKQVILYFQIHQPYRINLVSGQVDDISAWFIGEKIGKKGLDMTNKAIFESVSKKCYLPVTQFWIQFLKNNPNFNLNLSFSGTFLEQCLEYSEIGSEVLSEFKKLIKTGQVEVLDETYYHSLGFMLGNQEFENEVKKHQNLIFELFGIIPTTFRNTELIYSDSVGEEVSKLGYKIQFFENPDWADDKQVVRNSEMYKSGASSDMILIPRDQVISDALIYITSSKDRLVNSVLTSSKKLILIGTDYEFLGEHFDSAQTITRVLSGEFDRLVSEGVAFIKASSILKSDLNISSMPIYHNKEYTSWAHTEKNITVWRGNDLQEKAFSAFSELFYIVKKDYPQYLSEIRKLVTSCHFYFLGQKNGEDAEFVQLFSPYDSTEKALETYLNVIYQLKTFIQQNG